MRFFLNFGISQKSVSETDESKLLNELPLQHASLKHFMFLPN